MNKSLLITIALQILCLPTLCGCEKWQLDRQMEELCNKDSGMKVYETVKLSALEFDSNGNKRWYYRGSATVRSELLGPDYRYVELDETIAGFRGNIEKGYLNKSTTRVVRKSDERVLGESVSYYRVGGDGVTSILHWHPSSKRCPTQKTDLVNSIFTKGE